MSFAAERAIAAEYRGLLTAEQVQELLLRLESSLGRRPNQVLGPTFRVRWMEWIDRLRDEGHILQVALPHRLESGELRFEAHATVEDLSSTLGDEHRGLTAGDDWDLPPFPYLWNLRTSERSFPEWYSDVQTRIPDWDAYSRHVATTMSVMPAQLTALPPSWYDGTFTMRDQLHGFCWMQASRDGLAMRQSRSVPSGDAYESEDCWYLFTPEDALSLQPILGHSLMSQLAPDFTVGALDLLGGSPDEPFLGFASHPREAGQPGPILGQRIPDPHETLVERALWSGVEIPWVEASESKTLERALAHGSPKARVSGATPGARPTQRRPWLIPTIVTGLVAALVAAAVLMYVVFLAPKPVPDALKTTLDNYTSAIAAGDFEKASSIGTFPNDQIHHEFLTNAVVSGRSAAPSNFHYEFVTDDPRVDTPPRENEQVVRVQYELDGQPGSHDIRVRDNGGSWDILDPLVTTVGIQPTAFAPVTVGGVRLELPADHGVQASGMFGSGERSIVPIHAYLFPGTYSLDVDYGEYYTGDNVTLRAVPQTGPRTSYPAGNYTDGALPPTPGRYTDAAPVTLAATATDKLTEAVTKKVTDGINACFGANNTFSGDCVSLTTNAMSFMTCAPSPTGWAIKEPSVTVDGPFLEVSGGSASGDCVSGLSSPTPTSVDIEFDGAIVREHHGLEVYPLSDSIFG